jgi:hypothetical protein
MSNYTIFPYTSTTAGGIVAYFPGAYIVRGVAGNNGIIPIYASIPNFTENGMSDILNDKDAQVIVFPGFSLNLYADAVYSSTSYSYDNSGGTDFLYRNSTGANTASSCKLFYKFPTGNIEVGPVTLSITCDASSIITYDNISYRIYQFQAGSKTFSVTNYSTDGSLYIQALLIGGGGGGGMYSSGNGSGGGGAGTFLTTTFSAIPGATFTVTVGDGGAGGAASTTNAGTAGSPTSITRTVGGVIDASLNAGGGGGGGGAAGTNGTIGTYYGSTGGGLSVAARTASTAAGTAYTVTSGSSVFTNIIAAAFAGGSGLGTSYGGGGGGGAGAVGGTTTSTSGGAGGAGLTWTVTGSTYAGGGGGKNATDGTAGAGGTGGGGSGVTSTAGTVNTGGGGGAGFSNTAAGAGGSGICIIAVPLHRVVM